MAIINKGDRKYLIIIHLGYDAGKRKTRSKRVDLRHLTPKQAEKEIIIIEKAFSDEVKGNPNNDASMTLKRFVVELWRPNYAEQQLRPKTIASYDTELDRRILPELGFMKIQDIKPVHIIKFYSKLTKQTYQKGSEAIYLSDRTIKYQHQILSSIMGVAVDWQIIKENPCKYVSPPKSKQPNQKKINYWQEQEAINFLCAIQSEKLKYICASELALLGGLRTEEILGLDVNDITDTGIIIRRTSKLVDKIGMVVEECAKNETSERSVTLPESVLDNLRRLRADQKTLQFRLRNLWKDIKVDGAHRILLFTQNDGAPMYGKTLSHWFKDFIVSYNESKEDPEDRLSIITFHGLRHTNASLMIYLGADIRTSAARIGHAQTTTFLNIYSHMLKRADQEICDKLEDTLLAKLTTK